MKLTKPMIPGYQDVTTSWHYQFYFNLHWPFFISFGLACVFLFSFLFIGFDTFVAPLDWRKAGSVEETWLTVLDYLDFSLSHGEDKLMWW